MKKCIIIAALAPDNMKERITIAPDDLVLCADIGYQAALAQGIVPHGVLGDFDSAPIPTENLFPNSTISVFPKEKDETDTYLCYQYGKKEGYQNFLLVGGIGGRSDHTFANIQTMVGALEKGDCFAIVGKQDEIKIFLPGTWSIPRKKGWKLSLFSFGPVVKGVHLSGVAYPLENATLTWGFPLGTSNQWVQDKADLSFTQGVLMVILSNEG